MKQSNCDHLFVSSGHGARKVPAFAYGLGPIRSTLIAFLTAGVLSCSSVSQDKTPAETQIHELLKESSSHSIALPDPINDTLMEAAIETGEPVRRGIERFDVSVNNVPAKTFFLSLVADSGVNVVAHPEISGVISLELKNVSVREALDVTRDVYGYEYKLSNGIYTIYPRKLRTEVFPINYLDIQRVGVSDTGVLIGTISSDSRSRNGYSQNNNQGVNGASQQGGNLLEYVDSDGESKSNSVAVSPGARVQTLNKTNFWHSIHKTLTAVIGGEEDGRMVMTNPQSGLAVVTALPRELGAVRRFLEKSELSVKRQVVLETKIIEVELSDTFEAGINWGAISGALSATSDTVGFGNFNDVVFDGDGATESTFSSILEVVDITKLLKLLETQGHVQVLSSPRIATVNNQKAVIRVGKDEFFVTGVSNSTTSSASSIVSTPEIELDSFFSGIALDVTPQIAEDGDVILHVHPIVSNVQDQLKEISVGSSNFSLPLALRDIRESDSIVRARSGQVVVLGGLMQESTSDTAKKRPFLGDVPVLNTLFKARGKSKVKTELVILMRPIVVGDQSWPEEIGRSVDSISEIAEEYRSR